MLFQSEALIASSFLILLQPLISRRDLQNRPGPVPNITKETLLNLKDYWSQVIKQKSNLIAIAFTIFALLGFDITISDF